MSEDFISGLHDDLVEAMDRYERRSPRGRFAAGGYPQLLRPATLARVAAGAAIIVALVAAVLTVARESDVERPAAPRPQPNANGDTQPMPTPREQRMDRLREAAIVDEKPDGLSARQVANRWAQLFASSYPDACGYMSQPACERVDCVKVSGYPITGCTPLSAEFRKSFQRASVERIVIRGRKASATFTNGEVVELGRNGWDIWMISKVGEYGF